MNQRRMSPAPASPIPRSAMVQHSNRMQFLQIQQPMQPVQFVSSFTNGMNVIYKQEDPRTERNTNRGVSQEKENLKFHTDPMKVLQNSHNHNNQNNPLGQQMQSYIDTALRNQKEEMHRLYEGQQQQIKSLQQQYNQTQQQYSDLLSQMPKIEQQCVDLKEQHIINLENVCKIVEQQQIEKQDIEQLKQSLVQLNQLLINTTTMKQSQQLRDSQIKKNLEQFEYSYQKSSSQGQQISLDTYDMYIKKYESFNKQVNDYLLNRKLPDHLSSILNNTTDQSDSLDNHHYQSSPIKVLDETVQGKVSPVRLSKEEIDKIKFSYKGKMSTISEHENEDDEIVYQIDENGYVLNQEGLHLLDNCGRYIQLTDKDILYFKSKNQLQEV